MTDAVLDLTPIWITFKLAIITTVILLILGTPLSWWLSRTQSRYKIAIESIVALPLVLPPTVLGFYLLIALSPAGVVGQIWKWFSDEPLTFSFTGLVIGSIIYSFPFVVQPLQAGFEQVDRQLTQAAATLGAKPLDIFLTIVLPISYRSFVVAVVLGFAHTVGEFGVVLMIGGNIPGVTQVLSITIYDHVEALDYGPAHLYSAGLLLFSFVVLFLAYRVSQKFRLRLK